MRLTVKLKIGVFFHTEKSIAVVCRLFQACYECPFNLTDCDRPHCVVGDGQRRKIIAVDRRYSGPTIEVRELQSIVHGAYHRAKRLAIHSAWSLPQS